MAITPNVSPTQEITNLFRTVFDGTRMFLSIGSTAVTKFSELLKATKLCKEKHALDKGGLMSLAQIKTLVDDVSNGRDTLCTATIKQSDMDSIIKLNKDKYHIPYSLYGAYGTDDKTVTISYPGSKGDLWRMLVTEAGISDIENSEIGTEEKMTEKYEHTLTNFDELKRNATFFSPEAAAEQESSWMDKINTERVAHSEKSMSDIYFDKRREVFNIKPVTDKNPEDWPAFAANAREKDVIKDRSTFTTELKADPSCFRRFARKEITYHTIKNAVAADYRNLMYLDKKDLKIISDFEKTQEKHVKGRVPNSYFYWVKSALLQNPEIYPYLQGKTLSRNMQNSTKLAWIACAGGEKTDFASRGEDHLALLKGKGDPELIRYTKLSKKETESLCKVLIDKDPMNALFVMRKYPSDEMLDYAKEAFSNVSYMKYDAKVYGPDSKYATMRKLAGDCMKRCDQTLLNAKVSGKNFYGEGVRPLAREPKENPMQAVSSVAKDIAKTAYDSFKTGNEVMIGVIQTGESR